MEVVWLRKTTLAVVMAVYDRLFCAIIHTCTHLTTPFHAEALIEQDPRCDDSDRYFLSRDEALMKGFKKSVAFARIMDDRKKKGEELNFLDRHFLSRYLCTYLFCN